MAWLPKTRVFWPILLTLLIADCASKEFAQSYLAPEHTPHEVIGSVVRLTLAHNLGGAMGLSLGPYSRIGLALLALLALFVLGRLYVRTGAFDKAIPLLTELVTQELHLRQRPLGYAR